MSRDSRARRAAREEKKARAKRARRVERDKRSSQVRMTVVNASQDAENSTSLVQELQLCNSALLYADEVTLVSPRAALLKNAEDINNLNGIELLRVFNNVAPKFFPDVDEQLRTLFETIDGLPPRAQPPRELRDEYDRNVRFLNKGLAPIKETMQSNVEQMFGETGYGQLQEARRSRHLDHRHHGGSGGR